MKEYFKYIKNPTLIKQEKINWYSFFKVFFFSRFIIGFGVLGIAKILSLIFDFPKLERTVELDENVWDFILTAVICAPVFEELLFRLPLRMNRITMGISTLLIFVVGVLTVIRGTEGTLILFLVPLLVVLILLYLKKIPFKYVFYLSALLFGLAHFYNYTGESYFMLFFTIAVFVFYGTVLGFIRMKYGIQYSILLHMLINCLGILPRL